MPSYYYAVAKGRQTGVYYDWDEASKAVLYHPNAVHKKFSDLQAALRFASSYGNKAVLRRHYTGPAWSPTCTTDSKGKEDDEDDENEDVEALARALSRVLLASRKARR
jgi:Caulimovirus viroplasmin